MSADSFMWTTNTTNHNCTQTRGLRRRPVYSCWPTEQNPHKTSNYVIHLRPSQLCTSKHGQSQSRHLLVLHSTQLSLPSDVLIPQSLLRNTSNGAVTATTPPSKQPECALCNLATQFWQPISSKWGN